MKKQIGLFLSLIAWATLAYSVDLKTISFEETFKIISAPDIVPPKDTKGPLQFLDQSLTTPNNCFSGKRHDDGTFSITAKECPLLLNANFVLNIGYDVKHACGVGIVFSAISEAVTVSAVPSNCIPTAGFVFDKITPSPKKIHHYHLHFIKA